MKVNFLVALIVIPMLASIGLYTYAFISTRWSYIDQSVIDQHTSMSAQRVYPQSTHHIQFERRSIRHGFRSQYGLFGYCLNYKWLNLLTIKSAVHLEDLTMNINATSSCPSCEQSTAICAQTGCCMNMCDNIPDCPSYIDEKNCSRRYNQTRYYLPAADCFWQSTWIGHQPLPRFLSSDSVPARDVQSHTKGLRYYIMFVLFVAAPMFTCLALLILFCINCIQRFYSIPFAFVSVLSLASVVSGAGGLGLFLYEWIHERLYRADFTYEFDQAEAFILAFNPWMINVERLGLAFWLTVAAIGTSLFTTILSCCFCCGLQSDKSKLRIHVKNDKYEIVHMSAYDE